MQSDSGASTSLWAATKEIPSPSPLTQDTIADVCVIGAGISGLTTAYLLAKQGNSVVVLDDGPIGGGATGRTTAHLSTSLDDGYREYERLHGAEGARLAASAAAAAIDRIEKAVKEEGIDCDFERLDGYLFAGAGLLHAGLDEELNAAFRAGLIGVQRLARIPIDTFDSGQCLRFPDQGQFHPLKYLAGLTESIARHGGRIHCRSHARNIQGGDSASVETSDGYKVSAGAIVVATNVPINDIVAIHTNQVPCRSYVIALEITANSVPRALYWDTENPYHYVRVQTERRDGRQRDFLIVGGEDHRTGEPSNATERFGHLETWARDRFPSADSVAFRWSGQVMEPVDGLPFIGRNPGDADNVYIITGDSGDGMINGTMGGMLVTDLISGRHNAWASLFDPSRKVLQTLSRLVGINLDVAMRYTEHVTPGEVNSVDEIPPNSGAVLREGLKKLAVFRDAEGNLVKHSAVCPHMQCIVHWNDFEKSWDCPCHGSRFDSNGRVLNGPANANLSPAD
ncbi:MAG: FAD-dependent oxidoreductase [FCB group bacterium]|jgi:glycine/D-amino acid oxidase-like deaminating enzyme/nitrite reductase/ring-hydroxylating ferredoxin subunit|nr:FAD-dependent oxidoreductase [FCB group bacterium]